MVLCWVNIDQKTGRAQDFSDLGKCSRQQGLYQFVETKLIHCQTAGEPALYQTTDWYRLSCLEHFPKSEKSCTKPVWGQCWPNRDFFHFWLNKNKRKKWMAKIKCLKKPSIISGQVSKLLPRDGCKRPCFDQLNAHIVECLLFCWRPKMCVFSGSKHGRLQSPLGFCYQVPKLWYTAGISIYSISRMPRKIGSEHQQDRSGNIMVSPEKASLKVAWFSNHFNCHRLKCFMHHTTSQESSLLITFSTVHWLWLSDSFYLHESM